MTDKIRRLENTVEKCVLGLVAAAVALATFGCAGGLVTGAVENGIKERLPELIGPAASYDVKVHGSSRKMMHGRIRQVDIRGRQVWVLPELCMDSLDLQMNDVVADRKTSALKAVGKTTFEAVVSEKSLNEYLSRTRSDGVKVKLRDGKMQVWARPSVLGLAVNVRLTGNLVARGEELDFRVDQLQVIGVNAPAIAAGMVEDRINPIIDLGMLEITPELKSVTIESGAIRIKGAAHLIGESSEGGRS